MKEIKLIKDTDVLGQDKGGGKTTANGKKSRMGLYVFGLFVVAVIIFLLVR